MISLKALEQPCFADVTYSKSAGSIMTEPGTEPGLLSPGPVLCCLGHFLSIVLQDPKWHIEFTLLPALDLRQHEK